MRLTTLTVLALAGALMTGCVTSRHTTTARTAVEQALLTQSAEAVLGNLDFTELEGQSYFIKAEEVEAYEKAYLLTSLNERLLSAGMVAADAEEEADILIHPRVANAAIDDASSFLGVPELPIAIPGVGAISIPELVLYSHQKQRGRTRMGVYGEFAENDRLAFSTEMVARQRYYTRWTLLFLITFRTTDLEGTF